MTDPSDEVRQTAQDRMGDDALIVHGWSIDVGNLRKAIQDLPDDYELMVTCSDVDDCEIAEAHIDSVYPPSLGSPGLLIITTGQTVTSEYAFHERMDVFHMTGAGVKLWSEEHEVWYKLGENPSGV